MANVVGNPERELFIKALWFKGKNTLEKYYFYSLNVKRDYRWLLMFLVARFPAGRAIGAFFYRDRSVVPKLRCDKVNKSTYRDTQSLNETYGDSNYTFIQSPSIFKDLDVEIAIKSIKKNGYCLGLQLPDSILNEILEYAHSATISIDGNKGYEFKYSTKDRASRRYNCEILIGNYLAVNSECTAVQKLIKDPKLAEIAAGYLGGKPVLVRSQMGWTFVGSTEDYAQKGEIGRPTVLFHYDLDDYRAVKFFFYLTDVDSSRGSHRCVAGSHRKRKLVHFVLRGQSDQKIADYYGAENIVEISGQAGSGFIEDPFCFHRGSPPTTAPRLMIQLEFALNDYGMWKF